MEKLSIKIHESYRKVVAFCDLSLVGKKFEEGKRQLDVRENFYKGEEIDYESVLKMLKDLNNDYSTFNVVGEVAVKAAIEVGLIGEESVGRVKEFLLL